MGKGTSRYHVEGMNLAELTELAFVVDSRGQSGTEGRAAVKGRAPEACCGAECRARAQEGWGGRRVRG